MRKWRVTVRVRTWDGERPGDGGYTDVDTLLVHVREDGRASPVMVKQVSRADAIASGGIYTNRDVRVGPITPPYPAGLFNYAGGFGDATVDPSQDPSDAPIEIFWRVTGPGWPSSDGGWSDKIGEEFTSLHAIVILRANGRKP